MSTRRWGRPARTTEPSRPSVLPPPPAVASAKGPRPLPVPRVIAPEIEGPEDVIVDDAGRILAGAADGRVWRFALPEEPGGDIRPEVVARTGGRPLGLEAVPGGGVLVCDAERGLLRVDPETGAVVTLADAVAGAPLRFCSNAAAAADGTVYFTVSSRRYGLQDWLGDILEHTATGLLLRLRPGGEPEVLLDGLQFANGVALAPDESFVAVAETGAYRVSRYWLHGPRAGRYDCLADGLPGFPDNISRDVARGIRDDISSDSSRDVSPGISRDVPRGADGVFWVALAGPRQPGLDWLHRRGPAAGRAAWKAARYAPPRPSRTVRVLGIGTDGGVVHDLRRARSPYRMVTSVSRAGSYLVMGSLTERGVAVLDLPPFPPLPTGRADGDNRH
ncbi:SMP-30/gluconolactonase/LRE family protein [Streptomyces varsoviensis]|uniref:SMP-30/gluconolactonase/LRE family protein n=1 Tax=Streptomyces varsoviensis TaxID=67373 RepID=UPI0033EB8E4B